MELNRAEAFVNKIEKVYAPYSPYVRPEILSWAAKLSENALIAVYKSVRMSYSNQWKTAPDLPILHAAHMEYREGLAETCVAMLPDPDYEERKRTMTEEERVEGAFFLQRLLKGMKNGVPPQVVYEKWAKEHEDD